MALAIQHRGPDGQGIHLQGPAALVHRRLAIIDLATGAQPMSNEDDQVWLTYNGELYNYLELRDQLRAAGHSFKTQSDSEVVVHAWEEWGAQCVERFRGMFAFAIADYRRKVLFLARDHLGIKPLYHFQTADRLAFASELQGLLALDDCPDEIDLKSLDDYLFLQYIPPPRTIYRGVMKLAPAHRMTVGFDGRTSGPECYWKPQFRPEAGRSFEEWGERLEDVLRDSVRSHLVADVPFGAFLSGGIDSTAMVALMSEEIGKPVKTFAIGFEENAFNELGYARTVANRFATEHHEEMVRPDAVSILPQMVRHFGEPFGDRSAIPTYYVSQMARRHVTMSLSGDGGDEAFLGYARYLRWHEWVHPASRSRAGWKALVRPGLQALLPERFPATRRVAPKDWLGWVTIAGADVRKAIWRAEFVHLVDEPVEEIDAVVQDARDAPPEQIGQAIDYRTYLPNDILTKVDVSSMMHSLESRTPLTDVRVAEFAGTIPWSMNIRRNADGVWTGKHLLKRFVGKHFCPEFLERKKAGFSVPLDHWLAKGGALREEMIDRFGKADARIYRYFRPEVVRRLIDTHDVGQDNSPLLWQLLFLENWLEHAHDTRRQDHQAIVA
jgi:asparagine synthase (glutamine-hydrolysing)